MKILKGAKKVFVGIGVFFITLFTKLKAKASDELFNVEALYGIPDPEPDTYRNIWNIIYRIALPIIFIIGAIIYWKKSKSSKKKKIAMILLTLVALILVIFFITKIVFF